MLDILVGRRELGKTTLAVYISRFFPTRVNYDPRHMIFTTSDILYDDQVSEKLYGLLNTRAEITVRPNFDKERVFADMCEVIYLWLRDNPGEEFCLLIDECRFIKNPEKNPHFDYIVRCTPRNEVSVLLTCHGIVDVSPDLRRIADFLILFQLTMAADVETVREKCGDEVAEDVQSLEPYQYIVWNDSIHKTRKHTEKERWYIPLREGTPQHGTYA
jgi:hypothetical protein